MLVFVGATTGLADSSALLQSKLHGRKPCRRWFAFMAGILAAALVFAVWTGIYGLGATEPGYRGVAFGHLCRTRFGNNNATA